MGAGAEGGALRGWKEVDAGAGFGTLRGWNAADAAGVCAGGATGAAEPEAASGDPVNKSYPPPPEEEEEEEAVVTGEGRSGMRAKGFTSTLAAAGRCCCCCCT